MNIRVIAKNLENKIKSELQNMLKNDIKRYLSILNNVIFQ